MIIELETYTVKCDNCGRYSSEDEEYCGWNDKDFALECAIESDWIEYEENKHYCPDCYTYDDNDEIVIKKRVRYATEYQKK